MVRKTVRPLFTSLPGTGLCELAAHVGHHNAFAVVGVVVHETPYKKTNDHGNNYHGQEVPPQNGGCNLLSKIREVHLLTVLLITNGQLLATLSAARSQNAATIGSSHSLTETVLVVAATVVGLECSFHNFMLVLFRLQHQFGRQRYNI